MKQGCLLNVKLYFFFFNYEFGTWELGVVASYGCTSNILAVNLIFNLSLCKKLEANNWQILPGLHHQEPRHFNWHKADLSQFTFNVACGCNHSEIR